MRGLLLSSCALALVACGVTGPVTPPGGTVHGLVDTQRSITHRLPGRFRTTVTHAGVSRAGDLGYTIGTWTLRVDELPQFTDAQGGFITIWSYTNDRWRPLVDGRTGALGETNPAPPWSGVNDAAGTVRGDGSMPPDAEGWLATASVAVHVHGIAVADSGDLVVQWGEQVADDGGRADWILLWLRTSEGWRLRHEWRANAR